MSGETGELGVTQGIDSGIRLLEKPFTRANLLQTLDLAMGWGSTSRVDAVIPFRLTRIETTAILRRPFRRRVSELVTECCAYSTRTYNLLVCDCSSRFRLGYSGRDERQSESSC